ncbi:hypothetical protein V6N13_117998 [Hibiscus sabdariffa]|uniref:Uncharacterized protein n=1 Tax=Hibiscus sabdariffa TaxID=183260 RepID=A0ABR2Q921_9ROSI
MEWQSGKVLGDEYIAPEVGDASGVQEKSIRASPRFRKSPSEHLRFRGEVHQSIRGSGGEVHQSIRGSGGEVHQNSCGSGEVHQNTRGLDERPVTAAVMHGDICSQKGITL